MSTNTFHYPDPDPRLETVGRIATIAVGLAFLSVCVLLTLNTWRQCKLARIARDWPTTEATISSSTHYRPFLSQWTTTIDLHYRFYIDNRCYKGHRLCYGTFRKWHPGKPSMKTNPYRQQEKVSVHYNPDNPDESVVLTSVNVWATMHPVLFIVCLGFAGLFIAPGSGLGRPALLWIRSFGYFR